MASAGELDPVRQNILEVALSEFAHYGFEGSRIETIAAGTHTSKRMIYYHFGSKAGLYAAVLEYAYRLARKNAPESGAGLPPMQALVRFAENAFDNFSAHPDFIRLSLQENLQDARFLKDSPTIIAMNRATLALVRDIVQRGQADGSMRPELDPMDVYINFVGLCHYHVSARANYKVMFGYDTTDPAIAQSRRAAICDAIVRYVKA